MGVSYAVYAIVPADKEHMKKLASYKNFELIGVPVPAELEKYFDNNELLPYRQVKIKATRPDRSGLEGMEETDGFVIDVANIPAGTVKIVFEVSY